MFEILNVNGLATLQDSGRRGWRRYGVPASGPMDAFAFRAAALLVDNPLDSAALEIGGGDLSLRTDQDCVIAAAGAGYTLRVGDREFPLWDSCYVRAGWAVELHKSGFGMWGYLAAAGGFEARPVMGSRSTYLRGHFGGLDGRLLQKGDRLAAAAPVKPRLELAARTIPKELRPDYRELPRIEAIPGPQSDRFTQDGLDTFFSKSYKVSAISDRMGFRLEGPPLSLPGGADLTSEGIIMGAVQVPADGEPIVMMADCATAGGYPKIAMVASVDLPLLAQCTPGRDSLSFRATTIEAARERYRDLIEKMSAGVRSLE